MKRYLVVQKIDDQEFDEAGGFVLTAKPGDEITLEDEMAVAVNRRFPGALCEMDPKTKTDWES